MIEFNNKRVLVLGLKKSGRAAIRLLKKLNVKIFITDIAQEKNCEELFQNTTFIPYNDVVNELGKIDIIVKSPGIKSDIEILKKAKNKKIVIISEIELAYHYIDKSKVIVGITGTNGKTTTAKLITKILIDSNILAVAVGNYGYSFSDAILDNNDADVFVVELSSFQLLDIVHFRPHIGAILNLSVAHLDYHKSYGEYINAKMNLFKNMKYGDFLIYNVDDPLIKKRIKKFKCNKYTFSLRNRLADTFIENEQIIHSGRVVLNKTDVKLIGEHNLYNILAAVSIAKVFYIEAENIKNSIKYFENLPHRIQYVRKVNNVTYYNDSKSTNVLSTICAINVFKTPVNLIIGGLDRLQNFTDIITHKNVKTIIAYGETMARIEKLAKEYNKECLVSNNLADAITLIKGREDVEEIVLFSPASASWDQFKDYEERGNQFIECVESIEELKAIK